MLVAVLSKATAIPKLILPGENQESRGNLWFLSLGAVTVLSVPKKGANHHVPNDLSDD